jgi:lipoprotein-anchoring transpeptidase ErfK/SrfK
MRRRLASVTVLAVLGSPAPALADSISISQANSAELVGAAPSSNDARRAWLAEVVRPVVGRTRPNPLSSARVSLEPYLEDSTAFTTLLATDAFRDDAGRDWIRVQLPVRPNETSAWLPADAVVLRRTPVRIVVRLNARRLELWRGPARVASYRAGIGMPSAPTPRGTFALWDTWTTTGADRGRYGSRVLALTAHSNVLYRFAGGDGRIAIHGTTAASRIGRRSSHGCIVVSEETLRVLWHAVGRGTPVTIAN